MTVPSSADSTGPVLVEEADFDWAAPSGVAAEVRRIVDESTREDGQSPLDEQAGLALRHRGLSSATLWISLRHWYVNRDVYATVDTPTSEEDAAVAGFALVDALPGASEVEVNLVVSPAARNAGVGTELAGAVLAQFGAAAISAWSHGNHPAAASLAENLGFDRVRDLWVMRRPTPPATPHPAESAQSSRRVGAKFTLRTFQPGRDEAAFLKVNGAAFAGHPEQGDMTRADLDARMAEPWFDPAGFFLAESEPVGASAGELLGFHWTKVHDADPPYGEVYVVGISPAAQGMGLGKALTHAGLEHLASRGLGEVILYVESDNAPAVAVYEGLGFAHADRDTHVMYARGRPSA